MNAKELIFSDSTEVKLKRHLLFWAIYCSYFYLQSISPHSLEEFTDSRTYSNALISVYCFVPVCILSAYASVKIILPRFIAKGAYLNAIIAFILLFSIGTVINYLAAIVYFRNSGVSNKSPFSLGYLNTIWAMIISGLAIGLKITKEWYRQQKEVAEITRQKARNELNLKKNLMHPKFLYTTLDCIHNNLVAGKGVSSSMILVLSNLLSYSLYESEIEKVTLQNELNAVEDFIALEEMKQGNEIVLNVDRNVDPDALMINPMVILSRLQDVIQKLNTNGTVDWNIDVNVSNDNNNLKCDIIMRKMHVPL
jgi:sensor histidine kinase YesM